MVQSNEKLICDLEAVAQPSSAVTKTRTLKSWEATPYQTSLYSGVMLSALGDTEPQPVSFELGLHGYYKIYLGLITLECSMYTYFKLDSDKAYHGVVARPGGQAWADFETMHEILWRCAYLSGDKLTMKRPNTYLKEGSALLWVRCVEMTGDEIALYNQNGAQKSGYPMHAHIDTDFTGHDDIESADDALIKVQCLKNTDVSLLSQEVTIDDDIIYHEYLAKGEVNPDISDNNRYKTYTKFNNVSDVAYKKIVSCCHENGIRVNAAMRMGMASIPKPYTTHTFNMKFACEHPEYYIKTRDGQTVTTLSYAYPEVQDYMVGVLLSSYKKGFDGVTPLWIRGVFIGFEEPVLRRIEEKYPGTDGRGLTIGDSRLQDVWCGFFNEFMRKLRRALDKESKLSGKERCNIHTVGFFTLEDNKKFGYDIEQWAKEGLIDGFTAAMCRHWEEVDDCMSDTEPSLIDIGKYSEKVKNGYVLKRYCGQDIERMCSGVAEYQKIAEKYGLQAFYSINWEGSPDPNVYIDEAQRLYEAGAKGLFAWDTNGRIAFPPEWNITSKLSRADKLSELKKTYAEINRTYKILKFGDSDIGYINSAWRG